MERELTEKQISEKYGQELVDHFCSIKDSVKNLFSRVLAEMTKRDILIAKYRYDKEKILGEIAELQYGIHKLNLCFDEGISEIRIAQQINELKQRIDEKELRLVELFDLQKN